VSGWPWSRTDFRDWIDTMRDGLLQKDTLRAVRGWLSSDYMGSVMERPGVSDRVRQLAVDNARMWFENSTDKELSPPAIGRLAGITFPTLVILGTRDERVIQRLVDSLMTGLPNARLVKMDGLGHAPNLEEPVRFNQLVIEFLRDTTK
jgi:pimeloyl-ACP methyl ester carboxylesterase